LPSPMRSIAAELVGAMARLPPPDPRYLKALPILEDAVQSYRAGRIDEASEQFLRILKKAPDHPDALYFLGLMKMEQRKFSEALKLMNRAVKGSPRFADAHFVSGSILNQLGRPTEAMAAYQRAIAINPNHVHALNDLGNTLRLLNRAQEAIVAYDRAIALAPDSAVVHNNKGVALAECRQFAKAIVSYDRALALKPDYAEAHSNRGGALLVLSRADEALACFDRALALNPEYAEAINNRGTALQDLNAHREALIWHQRALLFNPDNAIAHLNAATAHLALGEYAQGWPEYEWRWNTPDRAPIRRDLRRPQWRGDQPLDGRTVLLHAEQGFGDMLQFARYVPMVAACGAKVILETPHELVPLLRTLAGVSELICRGDKLPPFDLHCPLLSLPLAFRTELDSIPAKIPYLTAPTERVAKWQRRLAGVGQRKIGLAWSGRSYPRNRSIPFEELETLLSRPDVSFVSLQQELSDEDRSRIATRSNLLHFGEELADFADTAGIISALDLVISIDTSIAHLAGAMGKSLWILLLFGADFRWLTDRDSSPWYPTARLFRQSKIGAWNDVVARVDAALAVGGGNSASP
jgi:tetratricopeptide (TPR) repeat protein